MAGQDQRPPEKEKRKKRPILDGEAPSTTNIDPKAQKSQKVKKKGRGQKEIKHGSC
jgi:hypothetical protein